MNTLQIVWKHDEHTIILQSKFETANDGGQHIDMHRFRLLLETPNGTCELMPNEKVAESLIRARKFLSQWPTQTWA